jgi:hypothetical protein
MFATASAFPGVHSPVGRWWLKSVVADGRDLLDAPLDIRESIEDAVATFTERPSELSGTVSDPGGRLATQTWVIVFSADPQLWFMHSRRVEGVRTDVSGRFSVRNLPPGDYFLISSEDIEEREWWDPAVLERLRAGSRRITIGEYETKQVDLTLATAYR